MKVSLLISTYNWPSALHLCLKSALNQTRLPDEIVIADDGSKDDTRDLIVSFQKLSPIPIIHVWHEDLGFRKTLILNRALARVSQEYIIQVDGDVVLNRRFIEDHLRVAAKGCFIRGTRASVSDEISKQMLADQNLSIHPFSKGVKHRLNAIRLPFPVTRLEADGSDVKGCNMAFWKGDVMAVNGYNNDLQGWGHEDEELCWRLVNYGVTKKIVKMHAVVYHMYHKFASRDSVVFHDDVLTRCKSEHITYAENGYAQIKES